jgi:carboxymethylenebutenolidase
MGTHITLTAADGHVLDAYLAEPDGPARGGVVVLQEIFGVNSHIRSVADGYAGAGFLAVAPALFDRAEHGVELGYDPAGIERGIAIARGKLDYGQVMADVRAAAVTVARAGKVGAVGYCWGGMLAAMASVQLADTVAAAVGYYGGGTTNLLERRPATPLLLHFGERDHAIPLEDVERIRSAWPDAEIHVYEGAEHGFNCDQRASHHAPSAALALERTLAFFGHHLAG